MTGLNYNIKPMDGQMRALMELVLEMDALVGVIMD